MLRRLVVFAGVLAGGWLLGSLGAALAEEAQVAPPEAAGAVQEIDGAEVTDSEPAECIASREHVDDADGPGTTVNEESSSTPSSGLVAGYLPTHSASADDTGYRVRVPKAPHVVVPETADAPSFSPD